MYKSFICIFVLFILFPLISNALPSQDTSNFQHNPTEMFANMQKQQSDFVKDNEIEQQRLFKNLFLIGFIIMFVFVLVLIYVYNSKIKQVSSFINQQGKDSASLHTQIKLLSMILNNVNNSVILASAKSDVLWVNNAFTSLFGYSLENIVSVRDFPLIHNYTDMEIQQLIAKAITDSAPVIFYSSYTNQFGKNIHFQRKILPIIDTDKSISNFIIIDSESDKK